MKIMAPPQTMPASAPWKFTRLQNRLNSISGPKAAPKPAHANETMRNTELLESQAMTTPTTAITRRLRRAISRRCLSLSFSPKKSPRISCDTEEEAARSCESAVDMVEAMMPERIRPATSAGRNPKVLRKCAISTMTVSEALEVVSSPITPAFVMPRPITPIRMATLIAITTQMLAILRDSASLRSSSIAMKRSRICGIPK